MSLNLTKRLIAAAVLYPLCTVLSNSVVHAAVDGPEVHWDWSMWGNKRALSAHLEKMAEVVAKETGGNFTIKIHYGGALSPAKENLDNIKLGSIQGALACAPYTPGKLPGSMVLSLITGRGVVYRLKN